MKMDIYWSQHKVFFLATLALFPEKLVGMEVEPLFYWAYFGPIANAVGNDYNESDYEYFNDILFYYQRDGYLTYEKTPHGLFEIKSVDSKKAEHDLIGYLEKWQNGRLINHDATKPPDVSYQQELFVGALKHTRGKHQSEPRIKLSDIFRNSGELDYVPPFWELVLSSQLIDASVSIKEIGYERNNGLYHKDARPYVDIKIVGKNLLNSINGPLDNTSNATHKAKIGINGSNIPYVELDGVRYALVNKALRTDKNPYILINHLVSHTDRAVTRSNGLSELTGNTDLTELARQSGFTKELKDIFFAKLTKSTANLKYVADMPEAMAIYIPNHHQMLP
jgi:hypothetical protein